MKSVPASPTTSQALTAALAYAAQLRRELTPTRKAVNPQGYADRERELRLTEGRIAVLRAAERAEFPAVLDSDLELLEIPHPDDHLSRPF